MIETIPIITCKALVLAMMISSPGKSFNEDVIKNVCKYSKRFKVHPALIIGVMKVETRIRHLRRPSKTNDHGIMQLHCPPGTKRKMCNRCDVKKLQCNIREGVRYMSRIKRHHRRNCKLKQHHYIQHYNWHSKNYGNKVKMAAYPWTLFQFITYEQTIHFK